ncbi:MAG: IclR family transcriptional regulator [Proteobacteria bacterium]|nr:IclR family transcriptional regulator [Pseudomonadota bacterium]
MKTGFHVAENGDSVRSVTRALGLLAALGKEGRSLTELSRAVGISPSTASRLLNTLQAKGFVANTDENKYVPGIALTSLLYSTDQWAPLRKVARAATEALRTELDETVAFFVRTESDRLCIESAESAQVVRRICQPGERKTIIRGAAGKALLAFGDDRNPWPSLFGADDRFELATESVRTVAELKKECEQIRKQGYAFSRQESTMESWAVAAPVYLDGKPVGVLSAVIPLTRFSEAVLVRVIKATKDVASRFSNKVQVERKSKNGRPEPTRGTRPDRNPGRDKRRRVHN